MIKKLFIFSILMVFAFNAKAQYNDAVLHNIIAGKVKKITITHYTIKGNKIGKEDVHEFNPDGSLIDNNKQKLYRDLYNRVIIIREGDDGFLADSIIKLVSYNPDNVISKMVNIVYGKGKLGISKDEELFIYDKKGLLIKKGEIEYTIKETDSKGNWIKRNIKQPWINGFSESIQQRVIEYYDDDPFQLWIENQKKQLENPNEEENVDDKELEEQLKRTRERLKILEQLCPDSIRDSAPKFELG